VISLTITLSETEQQTKTEIGEKDDAYLGKIEAKFQRDPLRDFGEEGEFQA